MKTRWQMKHTLVGNYLAFSSFFFPHQKLNQPQTTYINWIAISSQWMTSNKTVSTFIIEVPAKIFASTIPMLMQCQISSCFLQFSENQHTLTTNSWKTPDRIVIESTAWKPLFDNEDLEDKTPGSTLSCIISTHMCLHISTKVHFCAKLEVYSLRLIKWLITLLFVLSSWTVFYSIVHVFSQKHILTKDVISRHGREAQHIEIALFKIT